MNGRLLAATLIVGLISCGAPADRIIVAAGTTVVDSGLIDELVAAYRADGGGEVAVVGESTAQSLRLAESGDADVVVAHAPRLEEAFVEAGHARSRVPVFTSTFVLVGPNVGLAAPSMDAAFGEIARNHQFVSRGDGSGTHEAELAVWRRSGITPDGSWYRATGQGMGLTLQVADQTEAFTLTELGVFIQAATTIDLVPADVPPIDNPYSIIVSVGAPDAADRFAEWLTGPSGEEALVEANGRLFGEVIYRPVGE